MVKLDIYASVLSRFSRVRLFETPMLLQPARLHCPWDSPSKNTRVGCHALLQGILPTQGSNLHLLHCRLNHFTAEPPTKPQSLSYPPIKTLLKNGSTLNNPLLSSPGDATSGYCLKAAFIY